MHIVSRIGVGVMILGCFVIGLWLGRGGNHTWTDSGRTFSYGLVSDASYESANATAQDVDRTGAMSGIVAHHLLVGDKIAQTFAMLGTGKETTVVILSPNHFDAGRSALQTTDGTWKTRYGDVGVDTHVLQNLLDHVDSLGYESDTFAQEHGVSAIVPFVKHWFPRAKIVPIVIHNSATEDELKKLASAIESVAPGALVVASIDMSHNLPQHIQTPHDQETLAMLERGSCGGERCRLEIDANAVLDTLFEINRLRGTQVWNLTHHGSSLAMGATKDWKENTSHILGYFQPGEPVQESFVSLQFVGDVMLDRAVRWKIDQKGTDYPWRDVSRFLQGAQLRVANLEGTISEAVSVASSDPPFQFTFAPAFVQEMLPLFDVVSLSNNHTRDRGFDGELETQQWLDALDLDWFGGYATADPVYRFGDVSLIGYHQFGFSIQELIPRIEQESLDGQFVIVYPHWGEEYIAQPQPGQQALAEEMIQAGADLIIGSHPHVIQGIEIIDEVPVVYSLGNFVFDQTAPGTDVGLSVTVHLDQSGGKIYLSPVETRDSQPTPLSDGEASNMFETIARLSSERLASDILTGVIPFSYD